MEHKPLLGALTEEISDLLVVNLQITYLYDDFDALITSCSHSLSPLHDVLEGPWHNSFLVEVISVSTHGVSLTGACLTISKDCSVIAFHHILDNAFGALIVNLKLSTGVIIGVIESELPLVSLIMVDRRVDSHVDIGRGLRVLRSRYEHLSRLISQLKDRGLTVLELLITHRSASDHDLYSL